MLLGGIRTPWVCPGIGRRGGCHGNQWKRRREERKDGRPQNYLAASLQADIVCLPLHMLRHAIWLITLFLQQFLIQQIKKSCKSNSYQQHYGSILRVTLLHCYASHTQCLYNVHSRTGSRNECALSWLFYYSSCWNWKCLNTTGWFFHFNFLNSQTKFH